MNVPKMQQITTAEGETKFVISYPVVDEHGQPILDGSGQPKITNLTAPTADELVQKLAQANIEASRSMAKQARVNEALIRKPKPVQPEPDLTKPEEQVKELQAQRQARAYQLCVDAASRFCATHPEFWGCAANVQLITDYLTQKQLAMDDDGNYDIAYAACYDRLAPLPVQPAAEVPNEVPNEPPANDAPQSNAPQQTVPSPEPNQRRAPVGGLNRSQVSGRPTNDQVLTKAQAWHMLKNDPQEYERWMRDPKKNAILNAALAGR